MTKQEIEKAIENGESVYAVFYSKTFDFVNYRSVFELHPDHTVTEYGSNIEYAIGFWEIHRGADVIDMRFYETNDEFCILLSRVHKSAKTAEHFAYHKDITRTETLPFVTWEEFKEGYVVNFHSKDMRKYRLIIGDFSKKTDIELEILAPHYSIEKTWDLTEENFYKAYDECVRLFKGEK